MFQLLNRDGQENLLSPHLDQTHQLRVLLQQYLVPHILQASLAEETQFSVVVKKPQEFLATQAAAAEVQAAKSQVGLDVAVAAIITLRVFRVCVDPAPHHSDADALVTDTLLLSIKNG